MENSNKENQGKSNIELNISESINQLCCGSVMQWVSWTLNQWVNESLSQWHFDLIEKPSWITPLSSTNTTTCNKIMSLNWNIPGKCNCPSGLIGYIKKIDVPPVFEKKESDWLCLKVPDPTLKNNKMNNIRPYPQIPNYPMIICQLSLVKKERYVEI
jgi:hypothetical protein